jgi:2-polyprenyl-3-methyl-5-hydroxy-6-metoxy-1,4-benzoquinol methylase
MPIVTIENCPVCGSHDFEKIFDVVDYFSSKEEFPVCDCKQCGFRFTNNFPSDDSIGKYYDSPDYISHSDSKRGLTNKLYHLFRKYMLRRKIDIVASHAESGNIKLLDIGCGTGYFMNAVKQRGWRVAGIEKEDKARQKAISNFALDIKDEKGFFEMERSSFDVITLWHVLEHLEKLNESLEKINDILTPDGTVVIALPNHHSYDARFYQGFWAAYDVPRHLWHFSPPTIEKMLAKHHLSIVKRYRMPLDAFYIALLSEKYRGIPTLMRYVRAFLIGMAGFTRSIFNSERSSSMIYIAKRTVEK